MPLKRNGYPIGVVIQGDGDPATQYDGGPAMGRGARLTRSKVSETVTRACKVFD